MNQQQQAELIPTRPGARLRHARETLGMTVEQLAAETHIRESIITAIERDDTDHIAPVYLRGYIRALAVGLRLDVNDLEEAAGATRSTDPELRSVFAIERKRGFAERWLKAGSYVVASVLIAALVWQVTQQAVQFSQGRATALAPEDQLGNPIATAQQPAERSARPSTHLAASIASLEQLSQRPVDSESAAELAWSAINAPASGALEPDGQSPASAPIRIRVSADSWVEITDANGQQLELDLLRGGNERGYAGEPPFELMLGRASAVELEYLGEPVDLAPFIRGDVARLTLGEAEPQTP